MSDNCIVFSIKKDINDTEIGLGSEMSLSAAAALAFLVESLNKLISLSNNSDSEVKVKLQNGSLAVATSNAPSTLIDLVSQQFRGVEEGKPSDSAVFEVWKDIQNYMKKKDSLKFDASFIKEGETITITDRIVRGSKFRHVPIQLNSASVKIKFIKGELIEAGGKTRSNLHIEDSLNKNITYTVNCNRESAKKANKYLYSDVLMAVWETLNPDGKKTHSYCDVYNKEETYQYYRDFIEKINELGYDRITRLEDIHIFCRDLAKSRSFAKLRKLLRLFNHQSIDINILKTIQVILYPFKDQPEIQTEYASIDELFEQKLIDLRNNNLQNLSSDN